MKRRFIAIFLAGGLMLGLCGCGGGNSANAAPAPQAETTSIPEKTAKEVAYEEPEETGEDYSVDDLVNMWSSGMLTKEDLENMVTIGAVSYETSNEFLDYVSGDSEFDVIWSEESLESGNAASDSDTLSLLTTHVIEVEDSDGYKIRETIQLSPIFTEDDMDTVYALWEVLGNDASSFPSEESLLNENRMLTSYQLEYIVGTCMIENLTDGFSFTPDSPRAYAMSFTAEGNGDTATLFNDRSVSMVMYSDRMVYDSKNFSVAIGDARMVSDTWGPCTFVIALPNTHTPNQPDGYRYDEIQIAFDFNVYDPYDYPEYGTLKLEYFAKEVE